MSEFAQKIHEAVEDAIVKMIREGSFIQPNYSQRLTLDPALFRAAYDAIDMTRVTQRIVAKCEERMADHVLNSMATEFANDVKQIMGNKELREDIRSVVREKIRTTAATLNADGAA